MRAFSALIVLVIFAIGCSTTAEQNAVIKGVVKHHQWSIPSATIYVKKGAQDFPGTDISIYDFEVAGESDGSFSIRSLAAGDYYLYAVAHDSLIDEPVFGGTAVTVQHDFQIVTKNISVTEEGH